MAAKINHEATAETAGPSTFYGTAIDVIRGYCRCSFCGANLHFTHVTDFVKNLTQETARCPECKIKSHRVMHRLQ